MEPTLGRRFDDVREAAFATHELAHAQQQDAAPRTGLQRQRCKPRDPAALQLAQESVSLALRDPDANADQVIREVDALGGDAPEALRNLGTLEDEQRVKDIATHPGGRRILQRVRQAMEGGSVVDREQARRLGELLARYEAPAAKPTPDDEQALAKINGAIDGASAEQRARYRQPPLPLRLPVRLYETGREEVGGVYYDPSMLGKAGEATAAGQTYVATPRGKVGGREDVQFHAGFIRIGPPALSSPELIRSTLRHEHQHLLLHVERRHPDRVTNPVLLELRSQAATGQAATPDEELEVTSLHLVRDFDWLADGEVRVVLRYLAENLDHRAASRQFVDRAVTRIAAFAVGNETRRTRLLRLINAEAAEVRRQLASLVRALGPPRPHRPAPPPPPPTP
jgi:hypothetical protein